MKKPIFLTLALLLITTYCHPQESGIITYTVSHNWTKKVESSKTMSKTERERMAYVWGDNTEYTVKAELKFSPTAHRFEYQENEEYSQWRKGDDYIIYGDLEKNETFDVLTLLGKQYVVQDSLNCQNWKIKNDMKEIAGRICMNATYFDPIKEKEVVAWFALDLPVPLGPNKYCGLPGMILEINEANGAVVYTATGILLPDENIEIAKPTVKKKRKFITQSEYDKKVIKYIDECEKMQRPYFWGMAF